MKAIQYVLIVAGLTATLSTSAQMTSPLPRQAMRTTSVIRGDEVIISHTNEMPQQPMRSTSPVRDGVVDVTRFDRLPWQYMQSTSTMMDYSQEANPILIQEEEYIAQQETIKRLRRARPNDNEHPYDTPLPEGVWTLLLMAILYSAFGKNRAKSDKMQLFCKKM